MKAIVAFDLNKGIGAKNALPWHISEDLTHFKQLTLNASVIMGRHTFESILSFRGIPLPRRRNIVLTRNSQYFYPGVTTYSSIEEVLENCANDAWIIGGGEIYQAFRPYTQEIVLTRLDKSFSEMDTFFYDFEELFDQVSCESHFSVHENCLYHWEVWKRKLA